MKVAICAKKIEDRTVFWIPVNSKSQDEKEEIRASINVTLSKKAREVFNKNVLDTKNPDIKIIHADITDFWLKAIKGKDRNLVVLFINEMIEESEQKTLKW